MATNDDLPGRVVRDSLVPWVTAVEENAPVLNWELSAVDVDVLVETLGLPPLPYPLEMESPGVTFDERQRHVGSVLAGLADRGLVTGTDVSADLAEAFGLLAHGEIVIDGRLRTDAPLDLVGAVRGDRAVLAAQAGESVRISFLRDVDLVPLIVSYLPRTHRLAGNSMTVPHEAFTRALTALVDNGDAVEFGQILSDSGVRGQDVAVLSELARADGAAAQFGVAFRTPATDVYRQRRVWAWHATNAGGVLINHDSVDRPAWTTLTPADRDRLGENLGAALYALRYGQNQSRSGYVPRRQRPDR